jgi:hypothetical protein
VVVQSLSASLPGFNTNSRFFQRWSQQASPAAYVVTAADSVPSFATHQACAAGPSKSGLPHTPVALCLVPRLPRRQAVQFTRLRGVGALRNQGECSARSGLFLASVQVGTSSLFRSRSLVAPARLPTSNARLAKPAEIHWLPSGWRASPAQRANPSVKGTATSGLRPLASAPYIER